MMNKIDPDWPWVKTKFSYVIRYDDGQKEYHIKQGTICRVYKNWMNTREITLIPYEAMNWMTDVNFWVHCDWDNVEPVTKDEFMVEML